jgi:hypothetical protein
MTRQWIITDSDGTHPRAVTLGEYATAFAADPKIRLAGVLDKRMTRPAPRTLEQAALALANV